MTPPALCRRGCGRQADRGRELCRSCYLGAPAHEKATDDWVAMHDLANPYPLEPTEPLDALELWWTLPAVEPKRWAA